MTDDGSKASSGWRVWFAGQTIFARATIAAIVMGAYAAGVVAIELYWLGGMGSVGAGFHGILGLTLGLLLVLRTNTSYDRWWEGRKLWGQLINDSRNLAIKIQTCVSADQSEKHALAEQLILFAEALKNHLRRGTHAAAQGRIDVPKIELPDVLHEPTAITATIYQQLEGWRKRDLLGGFELLFLDAHAAQLMNICGACERIQKSPIAPSYRWFIRKSIALYLLTLPWGLVTDFSWWATGVAALCTYFLVGVELIAEEIEDPFGVTQDDLRLDEYCDTIKRSIEALGL